MIYIEPHNVVSTSSVQIRINVSLKLTADAQLGCGTYEYNESHNAVSTSPQIWINV